MVALTSSTQFSVGVLVVEGKNTSAIARELCFTRKTANGYLDRVLETLQLQLRSGADAPCHPPWVGRGSRNHLALV